MSIKELLDVKLCQALEKNPAIMKDAGVLSKNIGISIEGLGSWSFDFDDQGNVFMKKGPSPQLDCSISTSEKTFEGVIQGTVNVPMAYMMRKIKIQGDLNLAVKVGLGIQKAVGASKV